MHPGNLVLEYLVWPTTRQSVSEWGGDHKSLVVLVLCSCNTFPTAPSAVIPPPPPLSYVCLPTHCLIYGTLPLCTVHASGISDITDSPSDPDRSFQSPQRMRYHSIAIKIDCMMIILSSKQYTPIWSEQADFKAKGDMLVRLQSKTVMSRNTEDDR